MKLHAGRLAGFLLDLDLRQPRHEAHFLERLLVLLGPIPALGRAVEVVERDARADDVEHRRALVLERGLEQRAPSASCRRRTTAPRMRRPPTIASMQRSNGGTSFGLAGGPPQVLFRSAVAENCPLVSP